MTASLSAGAALGSCDFRSAADADADAGSATAVADLINHNQDATNPQRQQQDLAAVLTFSDLSSDVFQLQYNADHQQQQNQPEAELLPAVNKPHANSSLTTIRPNLLPASSKPKAQQTKQHLSPAPDATVSVTGTATPSSNPSTAHIYGPRKPSPGLAARLRALGFGNTTKESSPPLTAQNVDTVGRLPEEQIRKIDLDHQSASSATIVERRGRPWKGPLVRIPSRSNLKSSKAVTKSPSIGEGTVAHEDAEEVVKAEFLPEIVAAKPLEMDTNKYRLPDHTNGNGVKAQLDTRDEHLARDSRAPPSPDEIPPPPLPKDTPPLPQGVVGAPAFSNDMFVPDAPSYFNPLGLQRAGSIYTLSRASLATQLAQLTSIQLPDAESLSSKVSAIPTAQAATKALINAAEQIRGWIYKASEVIGGLESDDDVEWSAAGGREGVEEVEKAIERFDELINVYVSAIEELQIRPDIAYVSGEDLLRAVAQMEAITDEWRKICSTLHSVKAQVEIAMEWEELWNTVLGEIQNEMDELICMVFEMEERRHKSIMVATKGDDVDIGDLETIVEEIPPVAARPPPVNNRFSLPAFPTSPSTPSPGAPVMSADDSSLLALFARMQPLRASLDFLPMRLSVFEARAQDTFPTACDELEMRRAGLDASYKKLEKDAESLRKELGEDRWVLVFRGAGRQAQKMYESVERSVTKLKEAVEAGLHLTSPPTMSKKIESYDAKKTHYGPAIERVLSIIDKGVKDRLTVNGEILRLHNEMQTKWAELKERMAEMDIVLEELQADKQGQQLRDSISSMLSNDQSTVGSGLETPGSSPPSSVIMSTLGLAKPPPPPAKTAKPAKQRSASIGSRLPQPNARRLSSLPTPASQVTRKPTTLTPRLSAMSTPTREGSVTPVGSRTSRPTSAMSNKPRWNGSTNDIDTGHNFKPLSLTTPSPYAKRSPSSTRSIPALTPQSSSKLSALWDPNSRELSVSPVPEDKPLKDSSGAPRLGHSLLSFRERIASPGPYAQQTVSQAQTAPRAPRLASKASMSALGANRRTSLQPPGPDDVSANPVPLRRPASSFAPGRRSSLLPQPKPKVTVTGAGGTGTVSGRASPQAVAGAKFAIRKNSSASADMPKAKDNKPRWRG